MKLIALVLIALGIAGLVFGGIGYSRDKTVLDIGGIKATATEHKTLPIAPALSVISLIGGVGLLIADKRRV